MKRLKYIFLVTLTACSVREQIPANQPQIRGIRAYIEGGEPETRAAVTKLADYVGRSKFMGGDRAVFTNIRRTSYPLEEFTYPSASDVYEGVTFVAGEGGGWTRGEGDGAPERVYWTDAVSPHTFVAYSTPQDASFDWTLEKETTYNYYIGTLGNPGESGEIVFDSEDALKKEDLLVSYDTQVKAEPGGSVALVKFAHALGSVRVVVNINGFSSNSSAVDNQTVVSDMRLLHQPTYYKWMGSSAAVQPYAPAASRKDLRLWIPHPEGVGSNQAKTFTFYGITVPQPMDYLTTLDGENARYRKTELSFDVTYPDPLNPSATKTFTYTASLQDVCFESGYNTTINITLNHKDEQMVVGVDFEDWEYVATPDQSQLKKNATILHDTRRSSVTVVDDEKATPDDATWLYRQNGTIVDVYGHDGSQAHPFQISTAYQFLSFAYEVKGGRSFAGQYVALDADLTFEVDWIGVGDDSHPFEGTLLGGHRFINGIQGSPLVGRLGSGARIEQLQVNAAGAIDGAGLLANANEGLICGCRVVGDVTLSGSPAGAIVGVNEYVVFACYHIGTTSGTASVGGLAGSNSGTMVGCYQAGKVTGEPIAAVNTGVLDTCLYTEEAMTRQDFTDSLNDGILAWRALHPGYDGHYYIHQPAGYPHLNE